MFAEDSPGALDQQHPLKGSAGALLYTHFQTFQRTRRIQLQRVQLGCSCRIQGAWLVCALVTYGISVALTMAIFSSTSTLECVGLRFFLFKFCFLSCCSADQQVFAELICLWRLLMDSLTPARSVNVPIPVTPPSFSGAIYIVLYHRSEYFFPKMQVSCRSAALLCLSSKRLNFSNR